MPSLEEVRAFREKAYKDSMILVEKKGSDYNRDQQLAGDTLFNLKVCAILGVVDTPAQGILVRLTDKLMRLISLTKKSDREPSVKDESVYDTVLDFHNYVDYLFLTWMESRKP